MAVEWSTTESFKDPIRILGPDALPASDLTARLDLGDLPPNQRIFYRVQFLDLSNPNLTSEPVGGTFRTAPLAARDIRFAWSGDTAGQGWGINREIGGMPIYRTLRDFAPDFFIHSGDTIYADVPIEAEVKLDNGSIWRNVTTAAKSKVAETLDEFRGNFAYNLLDENVRRFNASIPVFYQWDDHEVRNNWYPGQVIAPEDRHYRIERRLDVLARRARQAFLEYNPIRLERGAAERIHRAYSFGPLLDLFILDERSFRGPNSSNRQTALGNDTAFLGRSQLRWLEEGLRASKATWKVIASDMPIGYIIRDAERFEGVANADHGPPLGRELEIAGLLSFAKEHGVRNMVWLTADVHHAAAIHYDPGRARFQRFDAFWEFISGPLHAGSFGPGSTDRTFGPEVRWHSCPKGMKGNRPPSENLQFFGVVSIDAASRVMRVEQYDLTGKRVYTDELTPIL
jgi:alkaline phosphatase D